MKLINKPIILTEYPKSGGSWVVSMIGDALQIPQRDIYVESNFDLFDIKKHPWYINSPDLSLPTQSVIKSHELPDSELIKFDASYIHLVRDGRDVIISKWFFEKDFCVNNGISQSFNMNFDEYVEKTAHEWATYIESWKKKYASTFFYEDFLSTPVDSLDKLLNVIGNHDLHSDHLRGVVEKFTKENFSGLFDKTFSQNTFVRKGVSGDWRNYFSKKNVSAFKKFAGKTLINFGYELNFNWDN